MYQFNRNYSWALCYHDHVYVLHISCFQIIYKWQDFLLFLHPLKLKVEFWQGCYKNVFLHLTKLYLSKISLMDTYHFIEVIELVIKDIFHNIESVSRTRVEVKYEQEFSFVLIKSWVSDFLSCDWSNNTHLQLPLFKIPYLLTPSTGQLFYLNSILAITLSNYGHCSFWLHRYDTIHLTTEMDLKAWYCNINHWQKHQFSTI